MGTHFLCPSEPPGGASGATPGGRPRLHLDGDKQPMQLSLSYTMADLDDILPPGSYKLDLVDRTGTPLGLTVDVEIGTLRNAGVSESQDLEDGPVAVSAGGSDLRFLLEANVRSTQLAFQHNERTLEAGLRMADTLREGIQSLAEAQADWIKSFIGSRAFLRNSGPLQLAALPETPAQEADVEEEDEVPATSTDRAMELGLAVVTLINNFMGRFPAGGAPKQGGAKFDLKSVLNWRHAAEQGAARVLLDERRAAWRGRCAAAAVACVQEGWPSPDRMARAAPHLRVASRDARGVDQGRAGAARALVDPDDDALRAPRAGSG